MNLSSGKDSKMLRFNKLDIPFVCVLYFPFLSINASIVPIICAGLPPITSPEGIDFVTTLPLAIRTLSSIEALFGKKRLYKHCYLW